MRTEILNDFVYSWNICKTKSHLKTTVPAKWNVMFVGTIKDPEVRLKENVPSVLKSSLLVG